MSARVVNQQMIPFLGLQARILLCNVLRNSREDLSDELRQMVRGVIDNFKLVYTKCSLETYEKKDVKGMYKKARQGSITQFTGVSAPFEEPAAADIVVDKGKKCCRGLCQANPGSDAGLI